MARRRPDPIWGDCHCRQALVGEDGDQRTNLALETAQNRLS